MRIVTANELQDWLSQGELLEKDSHGPKVVRLPDGSLLKIFRSRRNPLLARLPKEKDHEISIDKHLDLRPLFPADLHYYRFSGSLTTPPCTEGLRWLVMKNTVTLSEKQLEMFKQALEHSNNRPLQPLNGRVIVQ